MRAWYQENLGIPMESWGAQLNWKADPNPEPYSVLSFFKEGSEYMEPSKSGFMLNLRVDDLDATLADLRQKGVTIVGDPVSEEFGKFGWILDPDGNKIELWQQL